MMVIVGYRAELVIEIFIVGRSSASSGAGMQRRRRRRSEAPSYHNLQRWRVISMRKFKK